MYYHEKFPTNQLNFDNFREKLLLYTFIIILYIFYVKADLFVRLRTEENLIRRKLCGKSICVALYMIVAVFLKIFI